MVVGLAWIAATAVLWRGFISRPALPVHLLRGETRATDFALAALTGLLAAARVLAPVVALDGAPRPLWAAPAAILGAVLLSARRRLRSAAAPLADDALWLGGFGALAVVAHGDAGAFAAGGLLGAAAVVGLVGVLFLAWGRGVSFAITARPDFQVFAPNPDNRYALARVRVGSDDEVLATVPDNRCRFVHVGLYDTRMRRVRLAEWPDIKLKLEQRGSLRVHVGTRPCPDADVSFAVDPGRYYLTVRNYLPAVPERPMLPIGGRWDRRGEPSWPR